MQQPINKVSISKVSISKGVNFHLVYQNRYTATSFNPNTKNDSESTKTGGRFHPFESAEGLRIATKYGADHNNGAIGEVLMRDDEETKTISIKNIEENNLALITFKRDLLLVDLSDNSISEDISDLLKKGRKSYNDLRKLAATLFEMCPNADELRWHNKQINTPGMYSYVFFGGQNRVLDQDVKLINDNPLTHGEGLKALQSAATIFDFKLPEKYVIKAI